MQSSESRIDAILSRFPGPVTLYPSRKKWLFVLLTGGVLTFGGYLMISDGNRRGGLFSFSLPPLRLLR